MSELYFYSTPRESVVTLTLDTGTTITGTPCTANGRDDAHRLPLPSGTPTQGGLLRVTCDGHTAFEGRGIVDTDAEPGFIFDDIHLSPLPPPPQPPPPPNPDADPKAIIDAVYESGDFDLATHDGCGQFTEAVCTALHEQQSGLWGHIKKSGAQNQYNSHAVDAVQLLGQAGSTQPGIYDIVHDSVSPNASPACNYKGVPDPTLYLYPAPGQS
jgi:hypothetical protein